MNTTERTNVRTALIATGFKRAAYTGDLSGKGNYTETWTHDDGSTITIEWADREAASKDHWRTTLDEVRASHRSAHPEVSDSSGSITPEVLTSVEEQVRQYAADQQTGEQA